MTEFCPICDKKIGKNDTTMTWKGKKVHASCFINTPYPKLWEN